MAFWRMGAVLDGPDLSQREQPFLRGQRQAGGMAGFRTRDMFLKDRQGPTGTAPRRSSSIRAPRSSSTDTRG